ncbi:MAG TPA: hypothetical protein VNI84_13840 [Pyrinomonadaceae bacterium]|nr:hypothetical protein [Pyrinomonadaceae bacterium]
MPFGTLSTLDTLASSQQTIAQYGEDRAFDAIEAARNAHNMILDSLLSDFIERTTDRQRRYGGAATMKMERVDEFGRVDAQKASAGVTLGFPLELFQESIQWTRKFMQNATTVELAAQFTAAQDGHIERLTNEIQRALFRPTNYVFTDHLIDNVDLNVKALLNADGAAIPTGQNAVSFNPATHTHYLARAGTALAATDISAAIETVLEHHGMGAVQIYINRAQEAAVRAMPNFTGYVDARIVTGSGVTRAEGNLDPNNINNRAIGIFDAAEVTVKSWIPAGYMFAFVKGAPKPLVMRERAPGLGGLQLVADDEAYPLRARTLESEFGVAVYTRTNGAVLLTTANTYAMPTIAQ